MTSTVPPRDWTDIHWPDFAGGGAERWIAVLPLAATEQHGPHLPVGTDVMIAQAYLARVRELLSDAAAGDIPPASAGRYLHRAHRLSGYADAAYRSGAEELAFARRKRRARRPQKARHGDEPWRQQRRHEPGGAGPARATRASRRHHGLVSPQRRGGIVLRAEASHGIHGGAAETSIMLARYRAACAREAIADFPSSGIAMAKDYRWLSTHRPAPFAWQAQDLHPSGAAGDATRGVRGKRRAPDRSGRACVLRAARRCRQIRSANRCRTSRRPDGRRVNPSQSSQIGLTGI